MGYKDPEVLEKMYWSDGMTQPEIADHFDVNPGSISYHMKKGGVETRSGSEALNATTYSVSDYQHELLTGILMSDGYCGKSAATPYIEVSMVNREFVEWFDEQLGELSTGVRVKETDKSRQTIYRVSTRCVSELERYYDWYSSGEKIWPEQIELTPDVLKMLFVGDGTVGHRKGQRNRKPHIKICLMNEMENKKKIEEMFERVGFSVGWNGPSVTFSIDESERLWNYMGSPPPGFDYKWPENFKA